MSRSDSLPLRQGMLSRPRLHTLIQEGLRHPLLVMLAGPGYGKTQAMADYLAQCDARALWFRMSSLDNLHAHFWSHLTQALQRESADSSEPLPPPDFPDTLPKFDAFLQFLSARIDGREEMIWVFDDFGEIHDRKVGDFFRTLAEIELENFHFVLISNALARTESIAFMSSNRALILSKDLKFTRDEIAALCRMHKVPLEPDQLSDIERCTEGWPLPLHMLVLHHNEMSMLISRDGRLTHDEISRMFEERFFSAYSEQRQKLFVKLSLLNSFTEEFASNLYEGDKARLGMPGNHVFVTREPATGRFSYHYLYRLFLQKKQYLLTEGEKLQVWRKAAAYYASSGETMEAVACHRKCGDHAAMLNAICAFVKLQHGITEENATYFLEHIDLLSPDEVQKHPVADYLRAWIHLNTLELEKSETLLSDLERRLLQDGTEEARALLGDVYILVASIHMMRNQEDFGDYYRKAADCLPEGTRLQNKGRLSTLNNHNFSMADNRPGAGERMERAVHAALPWASKVLCGGMSGMEHTFSAEAAYFSQRLDDAQQHAYRAIYKAEADAQHDLLCNAHCILARIGLMRGDFEEMSAQIRNVSGYAEKCDIGALKEIRNTAMAWYYIKLHDPKRVPPSIITMDNLNRPTLARDRSQIVYANYLIHTGEYTRLIGMLEHPQGLRLTSGIWPDRICMFIMLAIGYHKLGNDGAAMKALWTAYDMTYHNGLTTFFIEAEDCMCALIDVAREQRTHTFALSWLDHIYRQAADFHKRATAIRATYRKQNPVATSRNSPLTKRETEVLHALSRGLTREEIAVEQFISVNTVKTFIRSIYNKLNANNRVEAVSIAISEGYIEAVTPERHRI